MKLYSSFVKNRQHQRSIVWWCWSCTVGFPAAEHVSLCCGPNIQWLPLHRFYQPIMSRSAQPPWRNEGRTYKYVVVKKNEAATKLLLNRIKSQ